MVAALVALHPAGAAGIATAILPPGSSALFPSPQPPAAPQHLLGTGSGREMLPTEPPAEVPQREQEGDRASRAAPGFGWGILWRVVSPRCGEGAREAPALARDSLWVQPMAGGAGPSPTAPAVTLSDELHAIRRC